jgi:hypothetical protein
MTSKEYERLATELSMTGSFLRGMRVMNKHPHDTGLELDLSRSIHAIDRAITLHRRESKC